MVDFPKNIYSNKYKMRDDEYSKGSDRVEKVAEYSPARLFFGK